MGGCPSYSFTVTFWLWSWHNSQTLSSSFLPASVIPGHLKGYVILFCLRTQVKKELGGRKSLSKECLLRPGSINLMIFLLWIYWLSTASPCVGRNLPRFKYTFFLEVATDAIWHTENRGRFLNYTNFLGTEQNRQKPTFVPSKFCTMTMLLERAALWKRLHVNVLIP